MTSQTGQEIITIHILPNISSKFNQTMKFGQLKEYNMTSIFLEKSYDVIEKLVPDPFIKNEN